MSARIFIFAICCVASAGHAAETPTQEFSEFVIETAGAIQECDIAVLKESLARNNNENVPSENSSATCRFENEKKLRITLTELKQRMGKNKETIQALNSFFVSAQSALFGRIKAPPGFMLPTIVEEKAQAVRLLLE